MLNAKEKYLRTMDFDLSCPALKWEMGYWGGTIMRWYDEGLVKIEGLPDDIEYGDTIAGPAGYWKDTFRDVDIFNTMGFDKADFLLPVNFWIYPEFKPTLISEDNCYTISINKYGILEKTIKGHASKPMYLEWPIKNMRDWEKFKEERFQFDRNRFPKDWIKTKHKYINRDYPLSLIGSPCGFFGSLRFLLGEENLFMSYYDAPELIKSIAGHLTDLWIEIADKVLDEVEVDDVQLWEDMCYKNGPLISPDLFNEFMMPYYKKLIGFLKERGVKYIVLDTDGDCWKLIPLFIEAGVTTLYPMEVQSGMNIVEVRKAFPKLRMYGGINKMSIAAGKDKIEEELRKVEFVLKTGGYIPMADHHVPPEVSWENFLYYRKRLDEIIEKTAISSGK